MSARVQECKGARVMDEALAEPLRWNQWQTFLCIVTDPANRQPTKILNEFIPICWGLTKEKMAIRQAKDGREFPYRPRPSRRWLSVYDSLYAFGCVSLPSPSFPLPFSFCHTHDYALRNGGERR